MNYKETQREKAVALRDEIFRDAGAGLYKNKSREFVLSNPKLNLWPGIAEDAIDYYAANKITWWEAGDEPTGHLLSSQVACANHLYFLRQREDLAAAVLNNISKKITKALKVDEGFVEFEKTGKEKLGGEKSLTRGANCTSVDAMMLGETDAGKKILVLIEWKYTECYGSESKLAGPSGQERLNAYKDLLADKDCPINIGNPEYLFYEPFYQIMRQTLLGWQMTKNREYEAEDWINLHIIPRNNTELRINITSPGLKGKNIEDAWKSVLKIPEKYIIKSPDELLKPLKNFHDTKSLITYLDRRYWS